eukprot:1545679-Amphidinium_carterae.1
MLAVATLTLKRARPTLPCTELVPLVVVEWSQFQSAVTRREKQAGAPSACQLRHRANYRQPRKD